MQSHSVVIVSPFNALDQIDARNNYECQRHSFLEVKLQQSEEKLDNDKLITVLRSITMCLQTALIKQPGLASQYKMQISNMFTEQFNLYPWRTIETMSHSIIICLCATKSMGGPQSSDTSINLFTLSLSQIPRIPFQDLVFMRRFLHC